MKQIYRKGLFVRTDLNPYELICKNCGCDFIFTLDECHYRNRGIHNDYLGRIICPKCGYKNVVNRNNKYKEKK